MVVCKCRKATKLYCFVHKVPVCGECICFPEHQICVVRTYSEWVIDGEYDWPPTCGTCQAVLEAGINSLTTRLGCLHVMHTNCLVSHIQSFPPHTAPAGYVCPTCSSSIWPPKSIKDSGSRLHSKLKEAIIQSGMEKNLFGNHLVLLPEVESRAPPPAFASDPLMQVSGADGKEKSNSNSFNSIKDASLSTSEGYTPATRMGSSKHSVPDIVEIDGPSSVGNQIALDNDPNYMKSISPSAAGATTRKVSYNADRYNSEVSYYADDEDGNRKKYTRRGPLRHKFLRFLLPFWSNALPTLPVTAPPRKDGMATDDVTEGRPRHHRSSRMDPRKILLFMAIMACMRKSKSKLSSMATIRSLAPFFLVFLFLASTFLPVIRCQSEVDIDATEVDEASDLGIVGDDIQDFAEAVYGPAPGVDTVCVFPKNTARVVPAGEETELLVGLNNEGESSLKVHAIRASIHLPFDHRMFVQNLTLQEFYNASVPLSAQATFPYIFAVNKYLQPGSFDLVGTIFYEVEEQQYQSVFYNGTIEVVESGGFLSIESVFLVTLGIALTGLFGSWIYGQIQHLSKKTKRVAKVEVGTGTTDSAMDEWLQGTAYAQSLSNKSKKKK